MRPETADAEARFLNRELSWLDFNGRVLEVASDPSLPLLERANFCSIFSNNLDEFFMVRVAGLMGQVEAGLALLSPDGRSPQQALAEIRERVLRLTAQQAKLWKQELRPGLKDAGLVVAEIEDLDANELAELEQRFDHEIFPVLTPLAVGPGQPFPYISGLSLSLGLFVRDPDTSEERFARVKVPELLPRFMSIGERGLFVPLERVIRHFLSWLFPKMEIVECTTFRVTRDADFSLSDEADDLLEAVELELRRRRFGDPVRVEVSSSSSVRMLTQLKAGLEIEDDQIYLVPSLLDLADVNEFVGLDRPDLKDEAWYPVVPTRFASQDGLFDEVRRSDVLVHHPYDSFAASFESFVRKAAHDPDVAAVKTTVYRTSTDSPNVPALIEAAEEGKQTVCLVEIKARFDEHRNIEWSRSLESAGVHVVYGFPNLKIHAKGTLVVRREQDGLRRYAHIGTGNYNAVTARLYEDFGLFTADEDITADLADLFNHLTGFGRPQRFRKLYVSPFNLRSGLVERIRECVAAAKSGKKARIRLKVNHLADEEIVDELYAAADAGVEVEIFARTTCTLRPRKRADGKEDIRVRTLLGRFFEHSRFFIFDADEKQTFLMGSSDLMPRNLDHRIELVVPIEDTRAQQELVRTFDAIMKDTVFAWTLRADGSWHRVRTKKGQRTSGLQSALMRRARARARRLASVDRAT
jgi:polyphosphate kinase